MDSKKLISIFLKSAMIICSVFFLYYAAFMLYRTFLPSSDAFGSILLVFVMVYGISLLVLKSIGENRVFLPGYQTIAQIGTFISFFCGSICSLFLLKNNFEMMVPSVIMISTFGGGFIAANFVFLALKRIFSIEKPIETTTSLK